jgi:hypothetical protein
MPEGSVTPDNYTNLQYSEKINSGSITSTPGNSAITRVFYINHAYLSDFLDALLGYAEVSNDGLVIRPSLPDLHPKYSNFYAMEATVTPCGLSSSSLQYTDRTAKSLVAEVSALYKSVDFDVVDDDGEQTDELYRFVSRTMNYAGEYFTINNTGMKFVSSSNPKKSLNIQPAKTTGVCELVYTWHWVPPDPNLSPWVTPNWAAIENCLGKINEETFDPDFMDCPAGTVLFLGAEPRLIAPRVTEAGRDANIYYDITMKFLYRNNGFVDRGDIEEYAGHNFVWDMAHMWWDLITHDGTVSGNRLYEEADLNSLFTVGA